MNKKQKKEKEFEPEFDSDDEEGIAAYTETKRLNKKKRIEIIKRDNESLKISERMMENYLEDIEQRRQELILEEERQQALILEQEQQALILEEEPKYALFGHGLITSAVRLEIPNGSRLVTTALCGESTDEYTLEKTENNFFSRSLAPLQMNEFADTYKDTWHGEDIIVRNSGSDITDSNISLLLFHRLPNMSILLCTSGLYEYEKTEMQIMNRFVLKKDRKTNLNIISQTDVSKIFRTSLYPIVSEVLKIFILGEDRYNTLPFSTFELKFKEKFPQKSLIGIINDLPPNSMLIASSCRIFDNSALSLDEQNEAKDNSFDRGERNNRNRRVGKGLRKTRRKYNMPRSRRSIKRKRKTLAFRKTRKH